MRRAAVASVILGAAALCWVMGGGQSRIQPGPAQSESASLSPAPAATLPVPSPEPVAVAVPAEELRSFVQREAVSVGRADSQPQQTSERLHDRAQKLRSAELLWLKDHAIDRGTSGDERFLSVYLIGLAPDPQALEHLRDLGRSPVPRTANEREYTDEIVLRAFALDAIVKRLSTAESAAYLRDLLARCEDPALARHARHWLARLS